MSKKVNKRGFLSGIQNWLGGTKEYTQPVNNQNNPYTIVRSSAYGSWGTLGGQDLDEDIVLTIPAVKTALDIISNTVATLPLGLFKMDGDNTPQEVEGDRRVRLLNADTNDFLSGTGFKQKISKDLILHGESVTVVERDEQHPNKITGLYPLDTSKLVVDVYTANGYKFVPAYRYNSLDGTYMFSNDDVVSMSIDSDDGIIGRGVLEKGSDILKLALAQYQFEYNLLDSGAMPSGILSFQKNISNDVLEDTRKEFGEKFGGYGNRGKVVALEGGAEYTPLQINPDKLQLNNSKTDMLGQIARLFNIPETMLNSSANKYNSNEENNIQFFQFCLKPVLETIESSLNKYLLLESEKDKGFFFQFNTDSIFMNTLDEKTKSYIQLLDKGVMSYNEIRNKLGLAPTRDGNDYLKFSLGDVLLNTTSGQATVFNTLQSDKKSGDNDDTDKSDDNNVDNGPKPNTNNQQSTSNSQQGAKK